MHTGKLVFAQVMEHLPLTTFRRCEACHRGEHTIKRLSRKLQQIPSDSINQLNLFE